MTGVDGQGRPGDTVGLSARPVGDGDGQDGLRENIANRVLGFVKDVVNGGGPSIYDIADAVLALPEVAALRVKAAAADRVREWAAMHDDMARQYDEAALSVRTLALVDEAQGHAEDCRAIAEGVRRALDGPSPC